MDTPATTFGGVTAVRTVVPKRTARVALALVAALLAGMLGGLGGTSAGPAAPAGDLTRVIVQARQDLGAVAAAVARQGGEVVDMLSPFGMLVADVPAEGIAPLQADPATGAVSADQPMRVQSVDDDDVAPGLAAGRPARPGPADGGEGAGVVLVDTGIDHEDVNDDVVARYDLSPSEKLDGHGHGTFMAGIVKSQAPDSDLVSVQVADDDGSTTLSRVLHGLAIADAARERHDAPVVLLAMAGDPGDTPDPIMTTLEMLWARGSTVVVPSGNRGDEITSPGTDPYLITVGAEDADFSGSNVVFGKQKPEVEADGTSVAGLLVEGSTIASQADEDGTLTGSGTSMAAAHVAGVAASLLSADPSLTPNGVKATLVDGELGVVGATDNSDLPALPTPANDGNAKASARLMTPQAQQRTANGLAPAGWTWTGWTWTGWTWTGWTWTGNEADWAGWTWTGDDWAGWTWTGWTWTGWTWTGWTWTGWTWTAASWGDDAIV